MEKVKLVEAMQLRNDIPEFKPGDTVKVSVKVVEGEKERVQEFQGLVMARRGSGVNATFTVRKVSNGVGVERIFQVHSPRITKIQKVKEGRSRRAKLYYVRNLAAKAVAQKTTA